ncbi:MAG: hypothetical protein RLZZ630_1479 [Bacteroidota bacterium]
MKQFLCCLVLVLSMQQLSAQCFVSVSSPQPATCGLCNGSVEVVFSGGQPPYAVNFNGQPYGSITGAPLLITNACPGQFMVSVTDGNNTLCTGMLNGMVSGPNNGPLSLQFQQNNPTCPTCSDGSILAQVSGGTPPYTYNWSNGTFFNSVTNLQAGVYFLYVTDAAGCNVFDTIFLGSTLNNQGYMSGLVYVDNDNNQSFTTGDYPVPYRQVLCQPSGLLAYSNLQGEYFFPAAPGNYTISYVSDPLYSVSSGSGTFNVVLGSTSLTGFDFPLQVDSFVIIPDAYTYCPLPRCNTASTFYTTLVNNGTVIDSGEVRLQFDPSMNFVSSQPPSSLSGNTLIFEYDSLLPGERRTYASAFLLPGAGSTLQLVTIANSLDNAGNTVSTDTLSQQVTVLCSFDPNDKGVSPEGDGVSHRVSMDSELRYMIRFQNTGNDTAFNVFITDTLAPGLDANSVQFIASSHPCWMQRDSGNVLRFHFTNILLPDSNVNEPASHGYVLFRCTGNGNNADPTVVNNTAAIFFDANAPVITNTTLTTFSDLSTGLTVPVAETHLNLQITPQPIQDQFTVTLGNSSAGEEYVYRIFDISGKSTLVCGTVCGPALQLQRNELSSGVYLLEVVEKRTLRRGVVSLIFR